MCTGPRECGPMNSLASYVHACIVLRRAEIHRRRAQDEASDGERVTGGSRCRRRRAWLPPVCAAVQHASAMILLLSVSPLPRRAATAPSRAHRTAPHHAVPRSAVPCRQMSPNEPTRSNFYTEFNCRSRPDTHDVSLTPTEPSYNRKSCPKLKLFLSLRICIFELQRAIEIL